MADATIIITLGGAQQFRALAKRLKDAGDGRALRRELNTAIRTAGQPAVREARHAISTMQITGTVGGGTSERAAHLTARARSDRGRAAAQRHAGLRRTIASATNVSITANGIRIAVSGTRLPPKQRTLPMAIESRKGWSHPVYGNREVWVRQRGHPWFYRSIWRHANDFRRAIRDAMDRIERRITG